ncbi:MAG: hypothetical protein OXP75_19915 [Rhodospirillales bacterium]|nr:hypothetical protein [Rhodospirillales bacterium]
MLGKNRYLPLAALAALTLATSGCLHDDDDAPTTDMPDMEQPMGGDGDEMLPPDSHAQALANVIDLVANDGRRNDDGENVGGYWYRDQVGDHDAVVARTYRDGGNPSIRLSHSATGELQYNVWIDQRVRLQNDPWTRASRSVATFLDAEELEGVTVATRSVPDHGLGSEWQVAELTNDYEGAGTFDVYVVTDVQPGDGASEPSADIDRDDYEIEITEAPALPADQDYLVVWTPAGSTLEGSLSGEAGVFSCANAAGCWFLDDRNAGGYHAGTPGISFAANGGAARTVPHRETGTAPSADYLAFGHWLYEPADATAADDYEFGVFASGGDAFDVSALRQLTGTAIYRGDAVGMYYLNRSSDRPDTGSFSASVEMTADFGSDTETGTIAGEVNGFVFEGETASSVLPDSVTLTASPYNSIFEGFGAEPGTTNIFDAGYRDGAPYPGGWIGGRAGVGEEEQHWTGSSGSWVGAFYGNGATSTDQPTSVAGTFGVYLWNDGGDGGLTGSFGAHR